MVINCYVSETELFMLIRSLCTPFEPLSLIRTVKEEETQNYKCFPFEDHITSALATLKDKGTGGEYHVPDLFVHDSKTS